MNGKVVGVNTAIYSPTGASVGIGFAIPSEVAKKIVTQIRQFGRPKRGWLGVHIQEVTEDIAEGLGLKELVGALIGSVNKDGPAAKAKLQAGDVILKVGDKDVKEPRNLPQIVAEIPDGTQVPVTIWRKGKIISVPVKIGEQVEADETGVIPSPESGKELVKGIKIHGMTLQPLTEEVLQRFDLATDVQGVLVVDVAPKSSASEKALRPGDIIMEIGQIEVKTPQQVIDQFKKAEKENNKSALLLINHNGEVRYVTIKIGKEDAAE
jgi:serine protease Do